MFCLIARQCSCRIYVRFTDSVVVRWSLGFVVEWQFSFKETAKREINIIFAIGQCVLKNVQELFCEKCRVDCTTHFSGHVWGINCEIQEVLIVVFFVLLTSFGKRQ